MDPDRVRATLAARAQKDASVVKRLRRVVELDRKTMSMMGGMPIGGGLVMRTGSATQAMQSQDFQQVQAELNSELDALAYDVAAEGDDVEEIAMWLNYNAESVLRSIGG